jgi:hypothetical protein
MNVKFRFRDNIRLTDQLIMTAPEGYQLQDFSLIDGKFRRPPGTCHQFYYDESMKLDWNVTVNNLIDQALVGYNSSLEFGGLDILG